MMTDTRISTAPSAFASLEEALGSADIAFRLDLRKLCHPHCPLPFDHYRTKIVYVFLGLMVPLYSGLSIFDLAGWWFWGPMIAYTVAYWVGVRPLAERWVRRKIVEYIMDDPERLTKIWNYGGVSLVGADGTTVTAPKDDWRRLVLPQSADRSR